MHQNCNQNRIFIQSMLGLNLFILISMLIFVNIILLISKFGRILHWIVKQIIIISLQELSHHLASGAENYLEVCNIVGEHNLCIVSEIQTCGSCFKRPFFCQNRVSVKFSRKYSNFFCKYQNLPERPFPVFVLAIYIFSCILTTKSKNYLGRMF